MSFLRLEICRNEKISRKQIGITENQIFLGTNASALAFALFLPLHQ